MDPEQDSQPRPRPLGINNSNQVAQLSPDITTVPTVNPKKRSQDSKNGPKRRKQSENKPLTSPADIAAKRMEKNRKARESYARKKMTNRVFDIIFPPPRAVLPQPPPNEANTFADEVTQVEHGPVPPNEIPGVVSVPAQPQRRDVGVRVGPALSGTSRTSRNPIIPTTSMAGLRGVQWKLEVLCNNLADYKKKWAQVVTERKVGWAKIVQIEQEIGRNRRGSLPTHVLNLLNPGPERDPSKMNQVNQLLEVLDGLNTRSRDVVNDEIAALMVCSRYAQNRN